MAVTNKALQYSSAALHKRTVSHSAQVLERLNVLSKQISSTDKAELYSDLNIAESSILHSMESELGNTQNFLEISQNMEKRLGSVDNNLVALRDIVDNARANAIDAKDPLRGSAIPIVTITESFLDSVSSYLNNTYEGRYLFAGSKTDLPPIADIQTSNLDSNDEPTNNYYTGNTEILSFKIDKDFELEYGVTADNDAFQKLIGALHVMKNAGTGGDPDEFVKAIGYLDEARDGISDMIVVLGNKNKYLREVNERNDNKSIVLEQQVEAIVKTDIQQATMELNIKHANLQAVFMMYARLSQISLVDFL